MDTRLNPSILAADFANLERDLARISTADFAHVDIMDNHFVPNLTFGLGMVERLQQVSPIPLDVHLMIEDPDRWAPGYAEVGAASVTFHVEAATDAVALARRLRDIGARARRAGGRCVGIGASGAGSATFGGEEEEVVGIMGPLYEAPLRVVIAFASPLGLATVLLGKVSEPEGRSFKDFFNSEIWLTNNRFISSWDFMNCFNNSSDDGPVGVMACVWLGMFGPRLF